MKGVLVYGSQRPCLCLCPSVIVTELLDAHDRILLDGFANVFISVQANRHPPLCEDFKSDLLHLKSTAAILGNSKIHPE